MAVVKFIQPDHTLETGDIAGSRSYMQKLEDSLKALHLLKMQALEVDSINNSIKIPAFNTIEYTLTNRPTEYVSNPFSPYAASSLFTINNDQKIGAVTSNINRFYQSTDGITYSYSTIPGISNCSFAASDKNNAIVVVSSATSTCAYSLDGGSTWNNSNTSSINYSWKYIKYLNSMFISWGTSTSICSISTDNGQTWTEKTLPSSAIKNFCYDNTKYVCNDVSYIYYSTDFTTWSTASVVIGYDNSPLIYLEANNTFFAHNSWQFFYINNSLTSNYSIPYEYRSGNGSYRTSASFFSLFHQILQEPDFIIIAEGNNFLFLQNNESISKGTFSLGNAGGGLNPLYLTKFRNNLIFTSSNDIYIYSLNKNFLQQNNILNIPETNITITSFPTTGDRIDKIGRYIGTTQYKLLLGEEGLIPNPPSMDPNIESICSIYLKKNTSNITNYNITDERSYYTEAKNRDISIFKYTDNLIPVLTSDTSNGTASASSTYSATYPAWKAFNGTVAGDAWYSASASASGWIAYEFTSTQTINMYSIKASSGAGTAHSPKTWTFEGWNGSSWDVLDTNSTGSTPWTAEEIRFYTLSANATYAKFRLNISASQDGSYVGVGELEVYYSNLVNLYGTKVYSSNKEKLLFNSPGLYYCSIPNVNILRASIIGAGGGGGGGWCNDAISSLAPGGGGGGGACLPELFLSNSPLIMYIAPGGAGGTDTSNTTGTATVGTAANPTYIYDCVSYKSIYVNGGSGGGRGTTGPVAGAGGAGGVAPTGGFAGGTGGNGVAGAWGAVTRGGTGGVGEQLQLTPSYTASASYGYTDHMYYGYGCGSEGGAAYAGNVVVSGGVSGAIYLQILC